MVSFPSWSDGTAVMKPQALRLTIGGCPVDQEGASNWKEALLLGEVDLGLVTARSLGLSSRDLRLVPAGMKSQVGVLDGPA